jgi:hypothetical protein
MWHSAMTNRALIAPAASGRAPGSAEAGRAGRR